ncbi:MAG: aminotransferase class I/II-fold pyridoxal phosphate-dependent enzyme [candidate division Zixibacteria bacterium]|nr:aminotransferase class I/II-fold pyridoxal phosphate-dependent enzyme [candidate division Zixibacteria bacterium]
MVIEQADRVFHLPPTAEDYLPRRDRTKLLGREVLDLARFSWPEGTVTKTNGDDHQFATDDDLAALAEKTAAWYQRRFGAGINPKKEIFIGGGIRQILNLVALSFFNPGEMVLTPDPGYWHYRAAVSLASADPIMYHLGERNGYRPVVNRIEGNVARLAKGMIINSPHNPTGAMLSLENLSELLHVAGKENLIVILDHAFETLIDGYQPASFFALPGGRKVALELYSYAYNMGCPYPALGFAVGQRAFIGGLRDMAGTFGFRLTRRQVRDAMAGDADLRSHLDEIKSGWTHNREQVDGLCRTLGLVPSGERGGPYYWAKLPGRKQSHQFCRRLYVRCGIMALPGVAFGENGEGFVRLSLTGPEDMYHKATEAAGRFFLTAHDQGKHDG